MTTRQRQWLGAIFFALMFGHLAINVYSTWLRVGQLRGTYDGWTASPTADGHGRITRIDPQGPAAGVLQVGDEILALNGHTLRDDPQLFNYYQRVSPGTRYTLLIRRAGEGEARSVELTMGRYSLRRFWGPMADLLTHLLFFVTGLLVFSA